MVQPRTLNRKITIQQSTESKDSYGDPISTWATYAIRSANPTPLQGRETFIYQQRYSESSMMFRLRYDSITKDITTKMRILYDGVYYDIDDVLNLKEQNRDIDIIAHTVD